MYERSYGALYDKSLSTKECAARMRAHVKSWQREGLIASDVKVSIRYRSFANGSAIDIVATIPRPIYWTDPTVGWHEGGRPWVECLTPEARALRDELEALHNAYNHDGSEIQVDYFDVKYYGQAGVQYSGDQHNYGRPTLADPMPAPDPMDLMRDRDWWPEYGTQ